MKITRKHLRNIIKEELSRLSEQGQVHMGPITIGGETDWGSEDEGYWETEVGKADIAAGKGPPMDDIEITTDTSVGPKAGSEAHNYAGVVMDAANELAHGYSDPLDALAEAILDGSMDLETAKSEAFQMLDLLAQLDNAGEIGVIEAAAKLGL